MDFMLRFGFRDAEIEAALAGRGYEIIIPRKAKDGEAFQIVLVEPGEDDFPSLVAKLAERLAAIGKHLGNRAAGNRDHPISLDIGVCPPAANFVSSYSLDAGTLRVLGALKIDLSISVYSDDDWPAERNNS